jgi:hypothetical protein
MMMAMCRGTKGALGISCVELVKSIVSAMWLRNKNYQTMKLDNT